MKIIINEKTPSINHLYGFHSHYKFLTAEGKALKKRIKEAVEQQCDINNQSYLADTELIVYVDIYENWYSQKDIVLKKDIANREKFLIDSVFEALGLDDKFIFEMRMRKFQSTEEEKAVITICQL